MIKHGLSFFFWVLILASCTHKNPNHVSYTITVLHQDSIHQLQVDMDFVPSPDGITVLEYPDAAWGQENLYGAIQHMEIEEVASDIEMNRDSGWIILNHPKNLKELQFQYVLQQDFEDPVTSRKTYRPVIQPEYFHLFSHNLFMVPKTNGDSLDIELKWKELDVVHNSFGSNEHEQRLKSVSRSDFLEAIFVGGDFSITEIPINGNMVYLATRGDWIPFEVEEMKDLLQETLQCQRDFWNDHSQDYFTVTMHPIYTQNGSSYQGTGLTNSFATSFSNNQYMEQEQMVHLFNHELMHNWIGLAIKNENEEEQYWFSEGFTEYYTFKNVAKNGINGLQGEYFIDSMNGIIKNLYALSIREAPNSEMTYDNFWSNREYQKLPYYRGALFAFYLDYSILKTSNGKHSLDDAMRDILKASTENGQKLNHAFFQKTLAQYLPNTVQSDFQKYIEDGKLLPLVDFFDKMDLEYLPTTQLFEQGFQFSTDKTAIDSVVEGSNADKAGLKTGDKVVSRSIRYGNTAVPLEIGVERDGTRLNFSFLPVKTEQVPTLLNSPENIERLRF